MSTPTTRRFHSQHAAVQVRVLVARAQLLLPRRDVAMSRLLSAIMIIIKPALVIALLSAVARRHHVATEAHQQLQKWSARCHR